MPEQIQKLELNNIEQGILRLLWQRKIYNGADGSSDILSDSMIKGILSKEFWPTDTWNTRRALIPIYFGDVIKSVGKTKRRIINPYFSTDSEAIDSALQHLQESGLITHTTAKGRGRYKGFPYQLSDRGSEYEQCKFHPITREYYEREKEKAPETETAPQPHEMIGLQNAEQIITTHLGTNSRKLPELLEALRKSARDHSL